jgi:2-polyprenyl-6-methoxyphenol hydroxylase-like FAD-dependent oxidoreductase
MVERIIIVGGGLAGLALAIALRQRGVSAEIVERADDWTTTGAGLYLVGNGTRALESIGVGNLLASQGSVIRTQALHNHGGARLAEIDTERFWADCGACLGLSRKRLHRLLADKAGNLRVRFGTTVQTLQQHEQGVSLRFSDGSSETYDFVVGADGIRSSIRRLEFGESDPRFRGQLGWRFIARRPNEIGGWTVFLGQGMAFLLLPIGDDQVYCYADTLAAQPIEDPISGRIERLRRMFQNFASPVREVLAEIGSDEQVHFSPIEEIDHQPWGRGKVLLIGDAAHAMSPNMACGAAMAFEDALVLAEVISRTRAPSEIIPAFIRRRSARIAWVREQTDRRDRIRTLAPAIRDALLRLLATRLYRRNYQPLLARP